MSPPPEVPRATQSSRPSSARGVALAVAILTSTSGCGGSARAAAARVDELWRTPAHASANVAFLMLRAHGCDVDYQNVFDSLSASGEHSSLQDLVRVCRSADLSCEAYSAVPRSLVGLEMPVIVHLDPLDADYSSGGRFALLARYLEEEDVVVIYDGTTAIRSVVPKEDFHELWSGAMVVATSANADRRWLVFAAGVLTVLAAVRYCTRNGDPGVRG